MKQSLKKHLSPHFTLYEFTRSGVAIDNDIDNTPNERQTVALEALCNNILEPLRQQFGPIIVSSGFRSRRVNSLAGGSPASQHMKGEAADIVVGSEDRATRLFNFVKSNLDFDQLILEPLSSPTPRWLHVSYTTRHKNRHSIVTGE